MTSFLTFGVEKRLYLNTCHLPNEMTDSFDSLFRIISYFHISMSSIISGEPFSQLSRNDLIKIVANKVLLQRDQRGVIIVT